MDLFARCRVVTVLLADGAAIDAVLGRIDQTFGVRVRGRTLINMATTAPGYSQVLEAAVRSAGGRYVEAPVSGSRGPCSRRCAARPSSAARCRAPSTSRWRSTCSSSRWCPVLPRRCTSPNAMGWTLPSSPPCSTPGRWRATPRGRRRRSSSCRTSPCKRRSRTFWTTPGLIAAVAREAGIGSPVLDVCYGLYGETQALRLAGADMVAVIRAIKHRTAAGG